MKAATSTLRCYKYLLILTFLHCTRVSDAASPCFGGVNDSPYQNWVKDRGSFYNVSACFNASSADTTQGVAIHWKIDDKNLYLAVAARAFGWVGFGLAEAGGMRGADMVIYESANPGQIRDAHVLDERIPVNDTCQDWVYKESRNKDGFLIFEAYRKLNTMDTQDRAIINDSNPSVPAQLVIAAWGDTTTASYHGPSNVVRASIRWYGTGDELESVRETLLKQSDGFFDFKINHTLKAIETDYHSFCYNWDPDVTSQGIGNEVITVIAAEVIPGEESRRFVHHADVFGANKQSNASGVCLEQYGYTVYSWAIGVHPFLLPDNVGYSFGPTSDNSKLQSFRIQIHYNNPELLTNITDTTRLRIYFTKSPRPQEIGLMGMGDVLERLSGTELPSGLSQYDVTCSSDCSDFSLDEPITVFQEGFHMHMAGVSAVNYHIRDNKVIREGRIDFTNSASRTIPSNKR
jgi:DOMON domain/Copper type II ascorbate-dependent monooxygenase, N-terminal domain